MPLKAPNELYYTPAEVQAILSINEPALRSLVMRDKLHRIIPPGKKQALFLRSEVDAFVTEWQAFLAGRPFPPTRLADAWLTFTDGDGGDARLVAVCIWAGPDDHFQSFLRAQATLLTAGEADIVAIQSERDISSAARATARQYGVYHSLHDGRDYPRMQLLTLGGLFLGKEQLAVPSGCDLRSVNEALDDQPAQIRDETSHR